MPQSLARVHMHLVFSTKHRTPWIDDVVRPELHSYMCGVLGQTGCPVNCAGSVEDHVHILLELSRTVAIADAVEVVKSSSSRWIKGKGPRYEDFAWQSGYAIFAVSYSNVETVRAYIQNQREHHRELSFQDEHRAFLHKHGMKFDERYIWD